MGLRELLEISQRSLSTPVQRARRPAPTIHKEVQTEAVADEIEVVTLPRPGAARTAIVKSLPAPEPSEQENDTGRTSADLSSGDSDETGSEDESIKFDTIQRAGRRRTMVEKEEQKADKEGEEKPEEKKVGEKGVEKVVVEKQEEKVVEKQKEQVVEKQEEKVIEKKQDGVVEKLLDEMVSKSMEDESSVKESFKEDEKAGVVESVVEQLLSNTVDGSSPALCLDNSGHLAEKEVKVLKVEEKLPDSDCTKQSNEKSDTAENHIDEAIRSSDTVKEVEVSETGETSKGSVE